MTGPGVPKVEPKVKAALGTAAGVLAAVTAVCQWLDSSGYATALPAWLQGTVTLVLALGSGGLAGYLAPHQWRLGESAPSNVEGK